MKSAPEFKNLPNCGKIETRREVEECVDMYLNNYATGFMDVDRDASIHSLDTLVRRGKFVRAFREGGAVVAWIYAEVLRPCHCSHNIFQQLYYGTSLKAYRVKRPLVALHQAMWEHARTLDVKYVVSYGNHNDENNIFVKILELNGWSRSGSCVMRPAPPRDSTDSGRFGTQGAASDGREGVAMGRVRGPPRAALS